MEDLEEALRRIEKRLDTGAYRPGEWATFVRKASRRSRPERLRIADQVSRVSEKLHLRRGWRTFSFSLAVTVEIVAAGVGVFLLIPGLARASGALVLLAAMILALTLQPLVKIAVGYLSGIRFSYGYVWYVEPRFKMRYGTYLVLPRWKRVLFHLCGTVGSPLGFWLVAFLAAPTLPRTASICLALFWFTAAMQIIPFVVGIVGLRPFGMRRLSRLSSAGLAAIELHEGFRLWNGGI